MQEFVERLALMQIEQLTEKLDALAMKLEVVKTGLELAVRGWTRKPEQRPFYPLVLAYYQRCLLCKKYVKAGEIFCKKHGGRAA